MLKWNGQSSLAAERENARNRWSVSVVLCRRDRGVGGLALYLLGGAEEEKKKKKKKKKEEEEEEEKKKKKGKKRRWNCWLGKGPSLERWVDGIVYRDREGRIEKTENRKQKRENRKRRRRRREKEEKGSSHGPSSLLVHYICFADARGSGFYRKAP